jgi:acetylglutamate kinase
MLNRTGAHAVGLSGKDGAMLRATRRVGHAGELTTVDASLVELMLGKGYVPVIAPVAMGDAGESFYLDGRVVAAGLAAALGAEKLIILDDAPGIIRNGELVSELDRASVDDPGLRRALDGGVKAVHLLDGRVPHSAIAELFTDSGVGTVIR